MTQKRIAQDGEAVAEGVAITDQDKDAMAFVQAIDAAPLTGVQRHRDGYIAGRVKAARVGVQTYTGAEVGWPERATVDVYRPLDEVMRIDALGSYKGKPITDGHPGERVTKDNWDRLARGTVMGVQRDGDAVALDVTVSAGSLIDKLEGGTARELSAGYVARIDRTAGVTEDGTPYDAIQRDIYIDHIAVVARGRAGSEFRIGDGADHWGASPIIATADTKESEMTDQLRTIMVDGLSVKITDEGAQAITKLTDALSVKNKAITDAETKIADLKKQVETKDGELKATKKSLEDATSPKALSDAAKGRAKTMEAGKKAGLSEDDMDKLDDAAIKRAVVAKSLGDEEAKAMSDAAIDGAFAFAAKSVTTQNDAALGGGIRTQDADPWASFDQTKKGA